MAAQFLAWFLLGTEHYSLVPTITEEDRVILNNVEKVVKFLTAGAANPTMDADVNIVHLTLY